MCTSKLTGFAVQNVEEYHTDRHYKWEECTGDRHYKWEECTGDRHYTQNQFTVQVFIKPVYSTCIHRICTGMDFNQQ